MLSVCNQGDVKLRILDVILFQKTHQHQFKPWTWIFTDTNGFLQSKQIATLQITDIIRAFLVNLKEQKTLPLSHEDLLVNLNCIITNNYRKYLINIAMKKSALEY
jgi:hypothetical protein